MPNKKGTKGLSALNGHNGHNGHNSHNGHNGLNGHGGLNGHAKSNGGSEKGKTYRPTDKEPFMNERQRDYFRQKLMSWRDEIYTERSP